MVEIEAIKIKKDDEIQVIIGHAGFIKTVEDLYEAMISSVPNVKFGLAFSEASGPKLIRLEGNDSTLTRMAEENLLQLASGHTFIIFFKDAFPINVANAIKAVPEVVRIYCATANPVIVIVAKTDQGNAVLGVVDGERPNGVEDIDDKDKRMKFLREIGYKR